MMNGGGAGNYVVTGAYNPQTNSLTFAGNGEASTTTNNGGLVVSNAAGNYDSLRSYGGYHSSNSNRSPRMLSTFGSNNVGQNNNSYITDAGQHNLQQHLLYGDGIQGDIV